MTHKLQDINTIYNGLEVLQARIRSTEALVMVKLDIARNKILTAGLMFSLASTCFTLGALIAGIFGERGRATLRRRPSNCHFVQTPARR